MAPGTSIALPDNGKLSMAQLAGLPGGCVTRGFFLKPARVPNLLYFPPAISRVYSRLRAKGILVLRFKWRPKSTQFGRTFRCSLAKNYDMASLATSSATSVLPPTANLNALADVAANLFISLPDSPQGKPFLDRADAGSPAALLRAMRRRLNLTQREFGILLSPNGASPISPSVICQLESALQTVPSPLVSRAVAATTAAQRLGEYLGGLPTSKASDAVGALKSLGPGCIDELQPYLAAFPELAAEEASLVREFLAIVTKRRHSTGGSRPGARVRLATRTFHPRQQRARRTQKPAGRARPFARMPRRALIDASWQAACDPLPGIREGGFGRGGRGGVCGGEGGVCGREGGVW